jgi:hypothetical protein
VQSNISSSGADLPESGRYSLHFIHTPRRASAATATDRATKVFFLSKNIITVQKKGNGQY